jgi:SAM-dependent methyltransferase
MVRTSGVRGTARALLQTIWRALHIRGFRRFYEPKLSDEMLRATSSTNIPFRADLAAATSGGFLYTPVDAQRFGDALSSLKVDFAEFVFIDIGCGRGRALVLAGKFDFKRIIGIEISPQLAREAQEVTAKFASHPEIISIQCTDARDFVWPETESLVLFLYNPFSRPVLCEVLARLQQSLRRSPRAVYVLYFSPELGATFESFGYEQLIAKDDWCLFILHPGPARG